MPPRPSPAVRARRPLLVALAVALFAPAAMAQVGPLSFFPLTPCRAFDTRNPPGPSGGPKLGANTERCFPIRGACGVPSTAVAVVINLTSSASTDFGNLRAYPSGTPAPLASVLNFLGDGVAIANGSIIPIGNDGRICLRVDMPPGSLGQVHAIGDVSGYFAP
jgi:hypothetical protein